MRENLGMRDYLQRINIDSTWLMVVNGVRFLVDPWLIGTETDGFKWLNRQWHVHSVLPPDELPTFDAILITQPYDDHCHIATLRQIYGGQPIFADTRAYRKIKRHLPQARLTVVNEKTREKVHFEGIEFWMSPTDRLYNGCCLRSADKTVLYLPHGIETKDKYLRHFPIPVDVVLTSASTFTLPFWLGGKVAKGIENVQEIRLHFSPGQIFTTHDEPKEGVGLVGKLAKKYYPTQAEFTERLGAHAYIVQDHGQLPF